MRAIQHRSFASPFIGLAAAFAVLGAACTPLPPAAIELTATPAPAMTATPTGCLDGVDAAMVWPQLSEVRPAEIAPGGEVTVIGAGGYVRCGDGAYLEGARQFDLFFDGQPAGALACYVNRCEAKLIVPAGAAAGEHVIAVEGGAEITIDVSGP